MPINSRPTSFDGGKSDETQADKTLPQTSVTGKLVKSVRAIVDVTGLSFQDVDQAISAAVAVRQWKGAPFDKTVNLSGKPEDIQAELTRLAQLAPAANPLITDEIRKQAAKAAEIQLRTAVAGHRDDWLAVLAELYGKQVATFRKGYTTGMQTGPDALVAAGGKAVDNYRTVKAAADELDKIAAAGLIVVGSEAVSRAQAAIRSNGVVSSHPGWTGGLRTAEPFGYSSLITDLGFELVFAESVAEFHARVEGR